MLIHVTQQGLSFNKLLLGGAFYFAFNIALNYATRKDQTGVTVTNPETGETVKVPANIDDIPPFALRPALNEGVTPRAIPKKIAPIWPQDSHVDIIVTLSPSFNPAPIDQVREEYVVLQEKDFQLNNYSDKRVVETTFPVPKAVQNNGTLWGHFYIGLTGSNLDPHQPGFDPAKAYHFPWPLTQYLPKKKQAKTRNLLENAPEPEEPKVEEPSGPIITNHYHPNASFSFVPDGGVKDFAALTPQIRQYMRLESTGARDPTGQHGWYCKSSISSPGTT